MVLPKNVTHKLLKKSANQILAQKQDQVGEIVKKENLRRKSVRLELMTQLQESQFVSQTLVPKEEQLMHMSKTLKLRAIFKNFVLRRFLHIKAEKSKLNIKQSVELLIKKNQEAEAKKRRKLKKKIEREFESKPVQGDETSQDSLYNRALFQFSRLLKILTAHS